MKQSAFLCHLGVQTMPKSLHCLSMRLTVEYFKTSLQDIEQLHAQKLINPSFQHYVLFSICHHQFYCDECCGKTFFSVHDWTSERTSCLTGVINFFHVILQESGHMIFHLVTDRQNFIAMKHWFARNSYKEATVHVLNFDDLKLIQFYNLVIKQLSSSEEFRVSIRDISQLSPLRMRTEYISIFGHSHFLLREINVQKS